MAPRDVIVKIKWNHQKIPNNIISLRYVPKIVKIDEKLTQLYLIKIGPVFGTHCITRYGNETTDEVVDLVIFRVGLLTLGSKSFLFMLPPLTCSNCRLPVASETLNNSDTKHKLTYPISLPH